MITEVIFEINYSLNNLYYVIGDFNVNSIDYATKNPSNFRNVTDLFDFYSLKSFIGLITRSTSTTDHTFTTEINEHETQSEYIKTDHFQTFPLTKNKQKMV